MLKINIQGPSLTSMADNLVIPSASASEMYNFIMLNNANVICNDVWING